jgi:hypothetical protein
MWTTCAIVATSGGFRCAKARRQRSPPLTRPSQEHAMASATTPAPAPAASTPPVVVVSQNVLPQTLSYLQVLANSTSGVSASLFDTASSLSSPGPWLASAQRACSRAAECAELQRPARAHLRRTRLARLPRRYGGRRLGETSGSAVRGRVCCRAVRGRVCSAGALFCLVLGSSPPLGVRRTA